MSKRRGLLSVALVALAVCGNARAATPSTMHPEPASLKVGDCLASTAPRCPGFLTTALKGAASSCKEVGGTLQAMNGPGLWTLDLNGDGHPEYLFELIASVSCDGAASLFDCGSLGCPKVLYEQRGGEWTMIAGIDAYDVDAIAVVPPIRPGEHGELVVGCSGTDPCPEVAHYTWTGASYDLEWLDVRGHRVDVASSVHGLYGLTRGIEVRATPERTAGVLAKYAADTEVAILGTVPGGAWYYVSPCNACDSGFIEKEAIRAK
jgi:hypothetical protein